MALLEADVPIPAANEVLIRVRAAGICGTDIHIKHDQFPNWPPVIMGHEFSGEIVEVGSEVTGYRVGDRVVGEPHTKACGKCELCRIGYIQICASKRSIGWGIHGAFAQYLVLPEHLLHRIPDSMTFEEAALVEPAANVVQDVIERGTVQPNDFVVITGPGPIGLLAVMAARAAGAREIALVGTRADKATRLPLGRVVGADHLLVAEETDPVAAIQDLTHGRGADLVVEASGAPAAIASSVHLVRRLGRITVIGMSSRKTVEFPWDSAIWKMCTITFNLSTGFTSWDKTIGLVGARKIDVRPLITHRVPLCDWERAFLDVEQGHGIKAVLLP